MCCQPTAHPTFAHVVTQDKGHLSRADALAKLGWLPARLDVALQELLRDGLAMVDDHNGQRLYWFPCCSTSVAAAA